MRLVIHQCSALQGAAILAELARWRRTYFMLEGDGLGACNYDRVAWLYERAAGRLVPGLDDERPEPQFEDYEPEEPIIEPSQVVILEPRPRLVLVTEETTAPAMRLLKGGWFREEEETRSA
jgi:hypothetical protein